LLGSTSWQYWFLNKKLLIATITNPQMLKRNMVDQMMYVEFFVIKNEALEKVKMPRNQLFFISFHISFDFLVTISFFVLYIYLI